MSSPFVHLHLHTQYSLLDGANKLDPLITQVKAFEMPAVAMTDHGNLFGAIEFYQKAKAAGIKPIIGCEAYLAPGSRLDKTPGLAHNDYYHLVLLASNLTGYRNLLTLVSQAYLDGFYYKPRMDKALLAQHHEGLIALSGCLSGEIPYLLGQGHTADARRVAGEFQEIFGRDHFYLEVQANGLDLQRRVNTGLLDLHRTLGIPIVGTNDCHYLRPEDADSHDVLLCLQTGKTRHDPNRLKFDTNQLYVKSSAEMAAEFPSLPEAILNTCRIAEQCDLTLPLGTNYLPHFQVPEGLTRETYLEHLAVEGLSRRLKERPPCQPDAAYQLRLREELAVIQSMGFAGYFLIVWDIINFARSRDIPVGPGRGSAAGSLVSYALRITDLDPLRYQLLFERFLNKERVSMPDIDMDFCMHRRHEVINYVIEKYGEDHVGQIITFGTLGAKAAIRDVGRVMELPYAEVDRVAKLVPNQLHMTIEKALELEPRLKQLTDQDSRVHDLIQTARSLEGLARHASTHAAGVVISDAPLTHHVPLYKTSDGNLVTQYSMNDIEKVGLIKFDFLGLKTLTMLQQTVQFIQAQHPAHPPLDLATLPIDDPSTYTLIASGHTAGVFQLESTGMRALLVKLKPENFEDITAVLALYRPGPLESGMVEDFIRRKQHPGTIPYDPPTLEPILKDTYGVIVYQEQVIAIANTIAGYTMGQADLLRRAMGKKKPEEMAKQKTLFIQGAVANGYPAETAEALFELINHFAGYGFNKSHSAAYAMISFQTAYLKAHYPAEFMAALLTCEIGNTDKMVGYFTECRDLGLTLLPPDINESSVGFTVTQGGIRFGLAAIKNVGEAAVQSLLATRDAGGPFTSFADCCFRVDLQHLNKRVLESFIKVGVFDSFGYSRAQLLAVLDETIEQAAAHQVAIAQGQTSFFDLMETSPAPFLVAPALPDIPEWDEATRLQYERELTGFYITSHPLARVADELAQLSNTTTVDLPDLPDGSTVTLCGLLTTLKPVMTKKGDRMAYIQIEDLHGVVEVIVFPDLYKTAEPLLRPEQLLQITGTTDRSDQGIRLKGLRLSSLADVKLAAADLLTVTIEEGSAPAERLPELKTRLQHYPGETALRLRLRLSTGVTVDLLPHTMTIAATPESLQAIEELTGPNTVQVLYRRPTAPKTGVSPARSTSPSAAPHANARREARPPEGITPPQPPRDPFPTSNFIRVQDPRQYAPTPHEGPRRHQDHPAQSGPRLHRTR